MYVKAFIFLSSYNTHFLNKIIIYNLGHLSRDFHVELIVTTIGKCGHGEPVRQLSRLVHLYPGELLRQNSIMRTILNVRYGMYNDLILGKVNIVIITLQINILNSKGTLPVCACAFITFQKLMKIYVKG